MKNFINKEQLAVYEKYDGDIDGLLRVNTKSDIEVFHKTTANSGFVQAGFWCVSVRAGVCTFFSEVSFFLSNFSVYL